MEKYVIFTGNITNMGGAQQYLSNKVRRLNDLGYHPVIISIQAGKVMLENLKPFGKNRLTLLKYKPLCYRNRDRQRILDEIFSIVGRDTGHDNYYIESNGIIAAEWAELTAKSLNCKHVCINLQELHSYNADEKAFLAYKYRRDELYGIAPKSIRLMLEDKTISEKDDHYIKAECTNVVEDIDCELLKTLPRADFNIGCIGRLWKAYVQAGIKEIVDFSNKHKNLTINIILIGGGTETDIIAIKKLIESSPNINLYITGYIYPIPRILIKTIDCFFSSAGSAKVSMKEGRPTVSMSAETGNAIGILNYTTTNGMFGNSDIPLSRYVEMILLEKYCDKHDTLKMEEADYKPQEEFVRQMSFFKRNDCKYYDVTMMRATSFKDKLYSLVGHVAGKSGLLFSTRLVSFVHKCIK